MNSSRNGEVHIILCYKLLTLISLIVMLSVIIALRIFARPSAQRRIPPFLLHITEAKRSFRVFDLLGHSLLNIAILVKCISALFGGRLAYSVALPIPVYHVVHVPSRVPNAESVTE